MLRLTHTLGHINCPACEASRQETVRTGSYLALQFRSAARIYLAEEEHSLEISPRTYKDHQDFVNRLSRFFGDIPIKDIHIGHVSQYQLARQAKLALEDNLGEAG